MTWNPNLPLRDLFYLSRMLQNRIKDRDMYGFSLVKIPTPRFVVFYNGTDTQPDRQTLRLSDSFEKKTADPELELCVTVYNINFGHNRELLEACRTLNEYAQYVQEVRRHLKTLPLNEAVGEAVEECIRSGGLREFLRKNKAEVISMCIFEYNEELHIKSERKIAMEAVLKEGFARGMEQGQQKTLTKQICKKMKKNKSIEAIARELETDTGDNQKIWQIAKRFAPDYDAEKVFAEFLKTTK